VSRSSPMLAGYYSIPELAAFLVAHAFFIYMFRQYATWFANRRALQVVLAFCAGVYAMLYTHLPDTGLQIAVAA